MPRLHRHPPLLFCLLAACGRPDSTPAPSKSVGPGLIHPGGHRTKGAYGMMTRLHYIMVLAALIAAGMTACGNPSPAPPETGKAGPVAGEAAVDKPFVGFRQAGLTIDRFETPVAPPVTPGSSTSPATLASDAPDVVSVQSDGALVAHRNGRANVRAVPGGGTLAVEVVAVSGLHAEPPTLRVGPGTAAPPTLKSGDIAIPAGAVTWYSNAPNVAMVEDGRVRAGPAKGTAILTAVYGGEKAQVTVVVGNRDTRRK